MWDPSPERIEGIGLSICLLASSTFHALLTEGNLDRLSNSFVDNNGERIGAYNRTLRLFPSIDDQLESGLIAPQAAFAKRARADALAGSL